jgi:hypothetical protein
VKLVAYIHDPQFLLECDSRLRSGGIPTLVRDVGPVWGTSKQALFVYIDSQYDDAVELLRNPNHRVSFPVDVKDFERASNQPLSGTAIMWLASAAVVLVILWVVAILLVRQIG